MKRGIWFVIPLLVFGASACSGGSATTSTIEASGTGLEGVEFIVHQVPG